MPLYEYQCDACGAKFELIRKFSDSPLDVCPKCGKGPVQKLVSSPAFQFKGSGWYITDYARKSGGEAGGDKKPAGESAESKADSASSAKDSSSKDSSSSDTKPAATTPSTSSGSSGSSSKDS